MPDDNETTGWDEGQEPAKRVSDPLGIVGWTIGGKYKIHSYIGGGGFGEVYDGHNVNLVDQRLVIKFFKRVQSRDKFDKEARILCMLDHPNISRVIDYLPEEGALVIAFIDGKDGGQILKDSGPLSEEMFLKVARTMTSALAYAHEKKIAHRDIKPDNILIDHNDHVYLIDFGIAKVMREDATKTAYQALTPMFAAPERQSGDANYNPFLSDIYEAGVTLFNFATNEMPYRNPANPDLSEWGGPKAKRLSSQLKKILRKATHPDPSRRYSSIAGMATDLKNLQQVYGGGTKVPYVSIAALIIVIAVAAFFTKDRWLPLFGTERETARTGQTARESKEPPIEEVIDSMLETVDDEVTDTASMEIASDETKDETAEEIAEPEKETVEEAKKPEEEEKEPPRIVTQTPEEKPVFEETKKKEPEKPKPPPPTPTYNIQISTVPEFNTILLVDGGEKSLNKLFELEKGRHEIKIINPDYPMLIESLNIQADRKLRYNLEDEYSLGDSLTFRVGALPPDLEDAFLEVSFNRHAKKYGADNLPILDLQKIIGKWEIDFRILTAQGSEYPGARVDSAVTFPYGGGPRVTARGRRAIVDFGTAEWKEIKSVDMLIYWSK